MCVLVNKRCICVRAFWNFDHKRGYHTQRAYIHITHVTETKTSQQNTVCPSILFEACSAVCHSYDWWAHFLFYGVSINQNLWTCVRKSIRDFCSFQIFLNLHMCAQTVFGRGPGWYETIKCVFYHKRCDWRYIQSWLEINYWG